MQYRSIAVAVLALCPSACSSRKADIAPAGPADGGAAVAAPIERATIECVSIEAPVGSKKAASAGGGVAFYGGQKLRAGGVAYAPSFTLNTQAAEGSDANAVRDELMASFTKEFAQVMRTANRSRAASRPPICNHRA